jgi:ABC-type protease/lipase transport system fused ATPase/permease subunit
MLMLTGPLYMLNIYDVLARDMLLFALTALVAFAYAMGNHSISCRGRVMGRVGAFFPGRFGPQGFASAV